MGKFGEAMSDFSVLMARRSWFDAASYQHDGAPEQVAVEAPLRWSWLPTLESVVAEQAQVRFQRHRLAVALPPTST